MNHIHHLFTNSVYMTVASGEGGADVSVPAVAATIEDAIGEVKRASQFNDLDAPFIVVLPFGRAVLLAVYADETRNLQPTLLTFQPDWTAQAEASGYRLEGPGTDPTHEDTFGQYWWTLTRPGWSGIDCGPSFRTEVAAGASMADECLREWQTSHPPEQIDEDSSEQETPPSQDAGGAVLIGTRTN